MTELTFAPIVMTAILVTMFILDLIFGTWSWFTTIEALCLVGFWALIFWADRFGPVGEPITDPETWLYEKFPDSWEEAYCKFARFWELNDRD